MYLTKITTVRFAGVPDGAAVDLSLVKLPADALIFPCPPTHGEPFSFAKLRSREMSQTGSEPLPPSSVSSFACTISGARMRRYCLTLACPYMWLPHAVLLRSYAKRTRKADRSAAGVIGELSGGVLGQ